MSNNAEDWALAAPLGEIIAYVWDCGDGYCNCTEAQIVHVIERNQYGGWQESAVVWRGQFHRDSEGYLDGGSWTDLNREAKRLRRHHHDLYQRISWPWDRKQ